MSSCDCHIEIREASRKKALIIFLSINAFMFVAELVVGLIALIDRSACRFARHAGRCSGLRCFAVCRRSRFKYQDASGIPSGGFQVCIAFGILTDIVRRAITGSDPSSLLMFIVSCVALVANSYCLRLISKEKEGEVHMRASYIFSKNDVLANLGVILASILIYFTGSRWPDLIIGMVITILVLRGGIQILKDAKANSHNF